MRIAGTYNDYKHNSSVKNEYISIEFSVSATSKSGTKWHMAQHSNFLFQFVAGFCSFCLWTPESPTSTVCTKDSEP
jgi:hypothetical protein